MRYRVHFVVFCLLLLAAWVMGLALPVCAQSAVQVRLREPDLSDFPLISVPVVVTGNGGTPLAGLGKSAFEMFEDQVTISDFQVVPHQNPDVSIAAVLALDLSNSAPMEDIKTAAHDFVDTLGPNVRVAVVGFSDRLDFTAFDPAREIDFTTDFDRVHDLIDGLAQGGGSAIYEAIYKAVLIVADEPAEHRAVIVMSDGFDTASRSEIALADTPRNAAKERGIPIFTVGLYVEGFGTNPNYLNVLARDTGGRYTEVTDPKQMGALLSGPIAQLETEYLITYRSQLAPDGQGHSIRIRLSSSEGPGEDTRAVVYPTPPSVPTILKMQRVVNENLQDLVSGAPLKGRVLIIPQITAQNVLERVEYYVSGRLAYTVILSEARLADYDYVPWEWRWNTMALEAGQYELETIAYDELGNASQPFVLEVTLEGGRSVNPWVIVLVLAALLLLGVALYLILRRSSSARLVSEPTTRTDLAMPSWPSGLPSDTMDSSPYTPTESAPVPSPHMLTQGMMINEPSVEIPQTETLSLRRPVDTMAWLVVEKGISQGTEFRLRDSTAIGRRGDNDIVLDDPSVSRHHAKVRRSGQSFAIVDLGASNPTMVNGQEIGRCDLHDGDRVEIGSTVMVFKQVLPQDN